MKWTPLIVLVLAGVTMGQTTRPATTRPIAKKPEFDRKIFVDRVDATRKQVAEATDAFERRLKKDVDYVAASSVLAKASERLAAARDNGSQQEKLAASSAYVEAKSELDAIQKALRAGDDELKSAIAAEKTASNDLINADIQIDLELRKTNKINRLVNESRRQRIIPWEELKVGITGTLQEWEISQIIDKRNMLIRSRNGAGHTVWLRGFPTAGKVDGDPLQLADPVIIVGTKQYSTAGGGTRVVFVLEPYDDYADEIRQRIEKSINEDYGR